MRARLDALTLAPHAELLHVLMLPDFEGPFQAVTEPTYAGRVVKVAVLLVCLGVLAPACGEGEPDPTIVYQFKILGTGNNVRITYGSDEAGLVETSATLRWLSAEYPGTEQSVIRIEADGPAGSRVKCVVRYRPIHGSYGGRGSSGAVQFADPGEDITVCALGPQSLSAEG